MGRRLGVVTAVDEAVDSGRQAGCEEVLVFSDGAVLLGRA